MVLSSFVLLSDRGLIEDFKESESLHLLASSADNLSQSAKTLCALCKSLAKN